VQALADHEAAVQLLRGLGFAEVDTGRSYVKVEGTVSG
jgi:hypothetical protein